MLIAQTIAKDQMVSPKRALERDEIEVMRAVVFRTADEELALRQALWTTKFVTGGLESQEVRATLDSPLVTRD